MWVHWYLILGSVGQLAIRPIYTHRSGTGSLGGTCAKTPGLDPIIANTDLEKTAISLCPSFDLSVHVIDGYYDVIWSRLTSQNAALKTKHLATNAK